MAGSEAEERNQEVELDEEEQIIENVNDSLGEYRSVAKSAAEAKGFFDETDKFINDSMSQEMRPEFFKQLLKVAGMYGNYASYASPEYKNAVFEEAKRQLPDGDDVARKNLAVKLMAKDAKADLEFLVNNEQSPLLVEMSDKFMKRVNAEYDSLVGSRQQFAVYKFLKDGLKKSGAQIPMEEMPDSMRKYLKLSNGNGDNKENKKTEEERSEIIDEIVDYQMKEVYNEEELKNDIVKARAIFLKASYKRRFKSLKDHLLKDYAQMHEKDFKKLVDVTAKAIAYKTGENAGKARLEGMEAYSKIADAALYKQRG